MHHVVLPIPILIHHLSIVVHVRAGVVVADKDMQRGDVAGDGCVDVV